jgi:hypothetical protein
VTSKPDPLHELAGRNRCDSAKSVAFSGHRQP